jgi:hypothetical protein
MARGRLGNGLGTGRRERPGADHGRGLHRHRRNAAHSGRKWPPMAGPGRRHHQRSACCTPNTAATCSAWPAWPRNWWKSWPKKAPASPTTAPSRPPAPSRCRWPTMPATASSRALPTTTAATSSAKARSPRKRSRSSATSCSPIATSSMPTPCPTRRMTSRQTAGLLRHRRRHHAQGARRHPGRRAEVGRQLDQQDRQRPHGLRLR